MNAGKRLIKQDLQAIPKSPDKISGFNFYGRPFGRNVIHPGSQLCLASSKDVFWGEIYKSALLEQRALNGLQSYCCE